MVEAWKKYIDKHPLKNELKEIISDIAADNLSDYTLKKMQWYKDHFRIRKGNIRIVFIKRDSGNVIKAVDTRGDIYKSF